MQEHGQHLAPSLGSKECIENKLSQGVSSACLPLSQPPSTDFLGVPYGHVASFLSGESCFAFPGGSDLSGAHDSSSSQSEPSPGTVIGS